MSASLEPRPDSLLAPRRDGDASREFLEKLFAAERAMTGVRLGVSLFSVAIYFTLLDPRLTIPWLALPIAVLGPLYSLLVLIFEPYRRFPLLLSSYVTTISDGIFTSLWIVATGGVHSPFYLIWYGVAITLAFRFDVRTTVAISVAYAALYVATLAMLGQLADHVLDAVVRSGFMVWVSLMAGLLGHYAAEEARARGVNFERALSAERAEKRFRDLLASCPEAIGVHSKGRVVYANPAAMALVGAVDANQIMGRPILDFVHPDSLEVARERGRRVYEEATPALEQRFVRLNGTTFDAEVQGTPIIYQGEPAAQIIIRDVSIRKAVEEMRHDVVRMLSHDIKNPLSAVMGFAEILSEQLSQGEDPREMVDGIRSAAQQAMALALNFLDADRIEAGALEPQKSPKSLNDIVSHAVRQQAPRARLSGVDLNVRLSPDVPVLDLDEPLVDRVVSNLVSNAIKFSPRGGDVIVATSVRDGRAVVGVQDHGPGVAPEDRTKLFQRYSRGAGSRTDSTGLGLFIVKTIAEAHGGEVALRCPPEGGSIFEVSFPMDAPIVT